MRDSLCFFGLSSMILLASCGSGTVVHSADPGNTSGITFINDPLTPLRSWRDYYPMDRGQERGQRVGNPWYSAATSKNTTIGAQLTWRYPALPGALSNAPSTSLPQSMAYAFGNNSYYGAHAIEYYENWWCNGGIFTPAQHGCTDTSSYSEIISEAPGPNGEPSLFLELWGNGGAASFGLQLDVAMCDAMPKDVLKDPSKRKPLLWGLPAMGGSTFVGPPSCAVKVRNFSLEDADILSFGKMFVTQRIVEEGVGSLLVESEYYAEAKGGSCATNGPAGVPLTRDDWGIDSCLQTVESYRLNQIGSNRLIGGLASWTISGTGGDVTKQPPADVDRDYAPTVQQFFVDVCANGACEAIAPSCVSQTCTQLGLQCGPAIDNCGKPIDCGTSCAASTTCGGGGTPNQCGCAPNNVDSCVGKQCGSVVNNCGQTIQCPNTCTGGATCAQNQCVCTPFNGCTLCAPDPVSKTCANLACGSAVNNCGQTVACTDTCGAGMACQSGSNRCGCSATLCAAAIANGTCTNGLCVDSCVPTTSCAAQGRSCGSVANGCSTEVCGSNGGGCGSGQVCSAAGVCQACVPTTSCAAQGRSCGSIPNGCGTEVCGNDGGACSGNKSCAANGVCRGDTSYAGCFADSDPRDLATLETFSGVTPATCTAACFAAGFHFAGVQDGTQCWCGDAYGRYGTSDACTTTCAAATSIYCGGVWANSVYTTGL